MKKIVAHAVGLALLATAGYVSAQTCAAPGTLNGAAQPVSGNTCNGTNIIGTYCDVAPAPQKEDIYSVTLASPTATSIALANSTGSGYTPALVLFQGTCVNGSSCAQSSFGTNGSGVSLSLAGVADGAYFLAVTSDPNAAAADCGAYNLTWTGTLPVKLQNFSVD